MSHATERELLESMVEALVPFLVEVGAQRLPSEQWVEVVCLDRKLWVLGMLYAALPALVEEAAEDAARHLYGEEADSALRFLLADARWRGVVAPGRAGRMVGPPSGALPRGASTRARRCGDGRRAMDCGGCCRAAVSQLR